MEKIVTNTTPSSLTSFTGQSAITMSSREIAALTGKDHKNVIRDIRAMLDALTDDGSDLSHVREDKDVRGYTAAFQLDRELTETLLTGYSIPLRRRVIARWHELESKVQQATLPQNYIEALEHLLAAKKSEQAAIEERDEALRTKSLIGSRREATAMATAAAAKRETEGLKARLGESVKSATVKAVENLAKAKFSWRPLMRWCDDNEIPVGKVPDEQYGQVNTYPAQAWQAVHGVSLKALFSKGVK